MAKEQENPTLLDDQEGSEESIAARQRREENILVGLRYIMALGIIVILGYLVCGLL